MLRGNESRALLQINNETLHRGCRDGRDVVAGATSSCVGACNLHARPRASPPQVDARGRNKDGIPKNRPTVRLTTNALSINAAPRGETRAYAAVVSAIVISANKPCDALARR
jgi:hypothetical protein